LVKIDTSTPDASGAAIAVPTENAQQMQQQQQQQQVLSPPDGGKPLIAVAEPSPLTIGAVVHSDSFAWEGIPIRLAAEASPLVRFPNEGATPKCPHCHTSDVTPENGGFCLDWVSTFLQRTKRSSNR
jgi:hypothetical protein